MLDIKIIRENPEDVIARLAAKGREAADDIHRILELDTQRRQMIAENETKKAEQNKKSKMIPALKKEGKDTTELFAQMKELSDAVKANDARLAQVENEYTELMLGLPNLPDKDLKPGGKENNEPLRYYGEPHHFDFEPKNHVDICTDLGLIDYKRGAKLSGNGFWIYRGMGARLEWALLNYFIDTHLADGYELVLVPHMLGYECGLTAGQFPKFKLLRMRDEDLCCLLRKLLLYLFTGTKYLQKLICPASIFPIHRASAERPAATVRMKEEW